MAFTPSGPSDGSGLNRSSRVLIIVIGCVILVALAASMLMRSGSNRPSIPSSGSGSQTEQR
jgi:hypothetical protein